MVNQKYRNKLAFLFINCNFEVFLFFSQAFRNYMTFQRKFFKSKSWFSKEDNDQILEIAKFNCKYFRQVDKYFSQCFRSEVELFLYRFVRLYYFIFIPSQLLDLFFNNFNFLH